MASTTRSSSSSPTAAASSTAESSSSEIPIKTSEATLSSSASGFDNLQSAISPQRPTTLFTKFNTDAAISSSSTSRQSPVDADAAAIAAACAVAAISGGLCQVVPLSPHSSTSSITSPSATSNFPPEMPQWKKDLIQRRKSNVARTIGALSASPVQPHSPSFSIPTTPTMSGEDHHAAGAMQAQATPVKGAKQIASQYDTLTATVASSSTRKTADQKLSKITINSNKMPAAINSPTKSPTKLTKISPTAADGSSSAQIGGHYSPHVERKSGTLITETGMPMQMNETATNTGAVPIPKQRLILYTTEISGNNQQNAGNISGNNHPHQHTHEIDKRSEPKVTMSERGEAFTTRLAGFEATTTIAKSTSSSLRAAEVFETQETETARKLSMSLSSSSSSSNIKCGTYAIRQSHSKFECERTVSSVSSESPSSSIGKINSYNSKSNNNCDDNTSHTSGIDIDIGDGTTVAKVCDSEKTVVPSASAVCGKISSKLQNNQFIKNQVIYQQQKSLENLVINAPSVGGVTTSRITSPTTAQYSTSTSSTSPNKFAHKNKKMVAMHEIKNTSSQQHTTHQLHHHHNHQHGGTTTAVATVCGRTRTQQRNSNNEENAPTSNIVDFDPSEDLSYGPGIVSKLRCRYLSLALRESMEKERHCLDNLRRATSLNNLLDRNDDEDDDDDDDEVDEDVVDNDDEEHVMHDNEVEITNDANNKRDKSSVIVGGGILKRSPQFSQNASTTPVVKKIATYQNNINPSNSNGSTPMNKRNFVKKPAKNTTSNSIGQNNIIDNSQNSNGVAPILRHGARHVKRGNDSLKRARSVEALLCEKTPWNFAMNRSSLQASANSGNGVVTIEDKINNARERLILGTDAMPPRRLTSIIDDTERPPPDLVKQTLKIFEATANRRGRGGQRGLQSGGEVANKVATFKSIIKEQKPALVFPKPPTSPNKKINSVSGKHAAKPVLGSAELLSSPIGRKTAAATAAAAANGGNTTPILSEMETQLSPTMGSAPILREKIGLSAISTQSDNLHRRYKLSSEPKSELLGSCVDSPVSALTKKLEKLCIENEKQPPMKHSISSKEFSQTKTITGDIVGSDEGAVEHISKLVGGSVGVGETVTGTASHEPSNQDKNIENPSRISRRCHNSSTEEPDVIKKKGEKADEGNNERSKRVLDENDFAVETDVDVSCLSVHNSDRDSNAKAMGIGTFGSDAATSSSSDQSDNDDSGRVPVASKRVTKTALENIAKAGTTQQFKFSSDYSNNKTQNLSTITNNKQIFNGSAGENLNSSSNSPHDSTNSMLNLRATTSSGKQIGVIRPLLTTPPNNQYQQSQQQHMEAFKQHQSTPTAPPQLTSREIEKNRINEMKKSAANASSMAAVGGGIGAGIVTATEAASPTTSLDTVINTNTNNSLNKLTATTSSPAPSPIAGGNSGFSELDATSSPLWALRKKRQTPPPAAAENTTMVFNFRNREKVPDHIENDGVIFRRKRVLPKPNESGFVRLPDLSLETSTDSDYDDFSMCPPSPCDVQFENANIVIDGKSSIRQRSKEATFRVQFNDTLTSTFEYPSEASLVLEDSFDNDHYANTSDIIGAFDSQVLEHIDSASSSPVHHHHHQHHHVAVDEIIPIPTSNTTSNNVTSGSANPATPTKNILGNLSLGSAPLGMYTPTKASIENIFELGVTRAPAQRNAENNTNHTSNEVEEDLNNLENGDDPLSLQYIKPLSDNLTIAYSEGTQKTDLLY